MQYVQEHHHRKHRNILYSLVVLLVVIQIVSFTVSTLQTSKLNARLDVSVNEINTNIEQNKKTQQEFATQLMKTYDSLYQQSFKEISNILTKQQQDFKQEINLLKSSQEDFSGVVEEAVKSVVSVSTGSSIGSGFIVNTDGYLVTNYHVINGFEDNVRILTYDRKVHSVEFIGRDELRDLALLKIEGNYDALELADSSSLQAGRKVIAIGNPLGLSFTVTEGIISAVDRVGPNGQAEYIQTDVSLNPGNSGGPLIDTQGKVVGINNFKIGGAESLGFALESDIIRKTINLLANQSIIA